MLLEPEELAELERQSIIEYLMSNTLGRQYVWSLLSDCGIYRSSWHPSELIHFNEGRRDVGLKALEEIMRRCPGYFLDMQREAMERASLEEKATDDNAD